jgi:hypothetical protein
VLAAAFIGLSNPHRPGKPSLATQITQFWRATADPHRASYGTPNGGSRASSDVTFRVCGGGPPGPSGARRMCVPVRGRPIGPLRPDRQRRCRWRAGPAMSLPDRIVVRGSACEAASCTSRSGTPASSAAVMNACRRVCGPTGLVMPARRAIRRTIRPAPCRSSRRPSAVRKIGPSQRSPTARSIARAVRGASGMVTTLPPLRVMTRVRSPRSVPRALDVCAGRL